LGDPRGGGDVLFVVDGGNSVQSERGARSVERLATVKLSERGETTARLRRSERR